jgi:hypothetical protein
MLISRDTPSNNALEEAGKRGREADAHAVVV